MDISSQVLIGRAPKAVWNKLWNVEDVARCIDGCRKAQTLEPNKRYAATVVERVGPFSVTLEIELDVVESEPNRCISVEAKGVDGKLGTRVRWRADVFMTPAGDDKTAVEIQVHAEVRGKIASLGEGIIKRRVQEGLRKFTTSFAQLVEQET